MVQVLLIDLDSKQENLYLMQLSAYHKAKGDVVLLNKRDDPDIVYISCLFKKNRAKALGIAKMFPNTKVEVGGTGINFMAGNLKISKLKPDYDLYPSKVSLGRTTWGCIRKCGWCCVSKKEGDFKRWQHVSEFYDERFDTVYLLDNNILIDENWFYENATFICEHRLKVREGGMDIRLLTPKIVKKLREITFEGMLHFAWDQMIDERKVIKGLRILKDGGFNTRREISIYVLTNYNTTREEDIYRCETLRNLNTNPFVMTFEDNHKADRWHKKLARQVNRKAIFWSDMWKDNLV
ncbi:MAG: hypothetical protein KAX49_03790 [Halanaerobiales bacterium]|nr:hypothetical protein [Halanaerobiales bacterium]